MEIKNLICIQCPMGCPLEVTMENGEVIKVSGNTCKRGEIYAKKEVTSPTRTVTSTVKVENGELPLVAVKTKTDIPKSLIFECMAEINNQVVDAPIKMGEVLICNICDTGADIVATNGV